MIGIILLIIALICYFKSPYRWLSYFLYISFMLGYGGGFGLWTDQITGIKNGDMAVIYTALISLYLVINRKYEIPKFSFIHQYKWLIGFLVCSILFSLLYYQFGPYYVLQGSRIYLLLFSLPILCSMSQYTFHKLMKALMWVTTITAVLYILQIAIGKPLMPYGGVTYDKDTATGLVRLYNFPALNTFFLTLSFVYPSYFGKRVIVFRAIYFMALMCTLGRTGILAGLMTVGLAMYFNGSKGKLFKATLILGILFVPFIGIISNRFEKGDTDSDLQSLLKGGATTYENANDGGTMTYRIAWVIERATYLANRPIGEQIFGFGLITDSYPYLSRLYNFKLGLFNKNTQEVSQLTTPDISYGNLVSQWGFGGAIVYLIFAFGLIGCLYVHRRVNPYITVAASSSIMLLFESFSGNSLSYPSGFVIYFIVLSTINGKQLENIKK